MKIGKLRRLQELAGAMRLMRGLSRAEWWPREKLEGYQRTRLEIVVRQAVAGSPFYRERLGGLVGSGPVELERLPVLDKATMMENYDEVVTDRRLRRDALLEWVEQQTGAEALYPGGHRVMTTSGSSGHKGLFVYDREGWRAILAQFLHYSAMSGVRPRIPRLRVGAVIGAAPTHMSRQVAAGVGVGVHRVFPLPLTMPTEELVARLNRIGPGFLHTYPSAAMRLAEEQLAGRLRISPDAISTSSELRTPEMTERIVEAFGVRPFDQYATTEGLWGCECERHEGVHLFEEATIVENVDEEGCPVPPGEPGARLLVTNLYNLVQPIIRLEVADVVALEPDPCPCGRTLARTRTIEGRTDDVLTFGARGGGEVVVYPMHFAGVTRDRDVLEFQVVKEGPLLRVLVVPRAGADEGLEVRLRNLVSRRLAELGVREPRVAVERQERLARSPGGKLQMVVADPAAVGIPGG
jgi:phenylacetate-CoA ligase